MFVGNIFLWYRVNIGRIYITFVMIKVVFIWLKALKLEIIILVIKLLTKQMNMKTILKLTIIHFAFFLYNYSFSQSLIEEGKNWSIVKGVAPNGEFHYSTNVYKIIGDTLINSLQYKVVKSKQYSSIIFSRVEGFIRMDSTKKVYYKDGNKERLIYDFNLLKNDTFTGFGPSEEVYNLIVDSVDSENLKTGQKVSD